MNGLFFGELGGLLGDGLGNPLRIWCRNHSMRARFCVLLLDPGEARRVEARSESDEGGPQAAVDKGHLAIHEAADEDIVAVANYASGDEDLLALRMTPPVSANCFSRDQCGDARHRTLSRFERHAEAFDQSER